MKWILAVMVLGCVGCNDKNIVTEFDSEKFLQRTIDDSTFTQYLIVKQSNDKIPNVIIHSRNEITVNISRAESDTLFVYSVDTHVTYVNEVPEKIAYNDYQLYPRDIMAFVVYSTTIKQITFAQKKGYTYHNKLLTF